MTVLSCTRKGGFLLIALSDGTVQKKDHRCGPQIALGLTSPAMF